MGGNPIVVERGVFYIVDIRVANVGSRIREARQRQGITQAQLADKINISISHLSAIESGRSNFGVDILIRMTEALGISADWLLNTGIPETAGQHSSELEALFTDCTSDEIAAIMRMAAQMKKDLHNAKDIAVNNQ